MHHATFDGLRRKAGHAAGMFILSFACIGASNAQNSAPPAGAAAQAPVAGKARLRVFAQNGINIHLYQNSVCIGKGTKTTVGGLDKTFFSSLFGRTTNTSLGMRETPNTRNLAKRDKLGSKAYFQEFEFAANEPVSVAMYFQSVELSAGCKLVGGTFVPVAGKQYELELDVTRPQCVAVVQEIADKGQGEVVMQAVDTVPTTECN
jgi:hypothetical protein